MYHFTLLHADINLAAIAGTATGALIAAPGATRAIRIVGGHVGCNRVAGTLIDLILSDTGGGNLIRLGSFQAGGTTSVPLVVPEPGIQLGVNLGLNLLVLAGAATGSGVATVYYALDTVS